MATQGRRKAANAPSKPTTARVPTSSRRRLPLSDDHPLAPGAAQIHKTMALPAPTNPKAAALTLVTVASPFQRASIHSGISYGGRKCTARWPGPKLRFRSQHLPDQRYHPTRHRSPTALSFAHALLPHHHTGLRLCESRPSFLVALVRNRPQS